MTKPRTDPKTHALASQELKVPRRLPLGTDALQGATHYIPVPKPSKRRGALKRPWRVVLVHPDANKDAIGLEIHGDVVLGRAGAASDPEPDFDLSMYDAILHGISRRHALLRPTEGQLFIIDLNSTNGTQVNAVAQEGGMARALRHNDTLSLGNLHLTVKIMPRA